MLSNYMIRKLLIYLLLIFFVNKIFFKLIHSFKLRFLFQYIYTLKHNYEIFFIIQL